MDFTILNNQFNAFWQKHNYNNALIIISELRNYFGADFSLYSNDVILKPQNLLISYAGRNGLDISQLDSSKITYTVLLNDFANYWNKQAKSIQDTQKRLQAIAKMTEFWSVFSSLDLSGIGGIFKSIGNFVSSNVLILGVVAFIIFIIYLKSK